MYPTDLIGLTDQSAVFLEVYNPSGRYLYSFRCKSSGMEYLQRAARTLLAVEPTGSSVVVMQQNAPFTPREPITGWAS